MKHLEDISYDEFTEALGWHYCERLQDYHQYHITIKDGYNYLYYNHESEEEGHFDMCHNGDHTFFLEDYFHHPLYPTKEECILFAFEKGYEYPINHSEQEIV